jgi:hypothetical protein
MQSLAQIRSENGEQFPSRDWIWKRGAADIATIIAKLFASQFEYHRISGYISGYRWAVTMGSTSQMRALENYRNRLSNCGGNLVRSAGSSCQKKTHSVGEVVYWA